MENDILIKVEWLSYVSATAAVMLGDMLNQCDVHGTLSLNALVPLDLTLNEYLDGLVELIDDGFVSIEGRNISIDTKHVASLTR